MAYSAETLREIGAEEVANSPTHRFGRGVEGVPEAMEKRVWHANWAASAYLFGEYSSKLRQQLLRVFPRMNGEDFENVLRYPPPYFGTQIFPSRLLYITMEQDRYLDKVAFGETTWGVEFIKDPRFASIIEGKVWDRRWVAPFVAVSQTPMEVTRIRNAHTYRGGSLFGTLVSKARPFIRSSSQSDILGTLAPRFHTEAGIDWEPASAAAITRYLESIGASKNIAYLNQVTSMKNPLDGAFSNLK